MNNDDDFVSDESSEEEEEKPTTVLKTAKFDKEGLNEKMEEIRWPEDVSWIQKLSIDVNHGLDVDVNDDLAREHSFYIQALEGTRVAFEKLDSMNLPFLRPADYYAEMVKTDAHMEKVKSKLLAEKKSIEESEERRKAREAKRLAKEVHAQKLKERAVQKKTDMETVKKWRKQREQSGYAENDSNGEFELDFENGLLKGNNKRKQQNVAPGDRSGGRSGRMKKKDKNASRQKRNEKFGFGGRKGLKKQNTAETTDDFRKFNKRKKV